MELLRGARREARGAHLRNIYAKLHVYSQSAAVAKAVKERLIKGL